MPELQVHSSGDAAVASNFIAFLNTQLHQTREELLQISEENGKLKEELSRCGESEALQSAIDSLRKELSDARALASTLQAETDAWKTRYEELKPQLAESAARETALLDSLREDLAQIASQATEGQSVSQFCNYIKSLPETYRTSSDDECLVVFKGNKFPHPLSKAVQRACNGKLRCFDASLQRWCPPSQHAYVMSPQHHFNPKPPAGTSSWSIAQPWTSLAGQQCEIFCNDGENISYAGTFLCQLGPTSVKLADLADAQSVDENCTQALARNTFRTNVKNQKTKLKTYLPLLTTLYAEGSATIQVLGLQRIGFNDKLFAILKRAYNKRADRAISKSYPEPAPLDVNMDLFGDFTEDSMTSAWGPVSTTPKKRARPGEGEDDDEEPEGREGTSVKAGSSKVPRLGEFAELGIDFFGGF